MDNSLCHCERSEAPPPAPSLQAQRSNPLAPPDSTPSPKYQEMGIWGKAGMGILLILHQVISPQACHDC